MKNEQSSYEMNAKQKRYLPVKRFFDVMVCLPVCIVLAPFMLLFAIAIKLDSPGPVLFKQKRVGKDKTYFDIWKFRTMQTNTPKDVPTHLLSNSEVFITRTGRFMRRYSIDELPQIYQCLFTNNLSLVGPRPALWNQDNLIQERDKYNANSVKPGITGWAQINGRDELEITDKARLDGEYVEKMGFWMDARCFLGTISSVLNHNGVVEGGTEDLHTKKKCASSIMSSECIRVGIVTGFIIFIASATTVVTVSGRIIKYFKYNKKSKKENIKNNRCKGIIGGAALVSAIYTVYINAKRRVMLQDNFLNGNVSENDFDDNMSEIANQPAGAKVLLKGKAESREYKSILITGANSYIGMSVERWLKAENERQGKEIYRISTLDVTDASWHRYDFSAHDVVYHVAGIAHADVGKVTEEQKQLYYRVNTDLAVEVAKKSKSSGIKQFIFMSSIIVYSGCKEKLITSNTIPKPLNFYGDSKWQAEQKIQAIENGDFKVVILRPPMIYGKNSKGNYPELAKLAGKLIAFPVVKNTRSMLYIDNLSQIVKLLIDNNESGVFFPQNMEYTNTSDLVQMIAKVKKHKIFMIPFTNQLIKLMGRIPGNIGDLVEKAFGDFAYEMEMSEYKKDYRVYTLWESIKLTEGVENKK